MVAGILLGLVVHLKIYPTVYGPAIIWGFECRDSEELGGLGMPLGL